MQNVAGVFNNKMDANKGLSELLDAGFKKEDISLIVSDKARNAIFPMSTSDVGEKATRGGTAGALWGGAIGALLAGLTTIGSLTIPGVGLLVTGPIIAVLAGAGAGASVGGLSGALINAGFAADEARRYEDEIKAGRAVVIVRTSDENADKARGLLRSINAAVKAA